jgi:large subunit ribosomal protein L4e
VTNVTERTADVLDLNGKKIKEISLPEVFSTPFRPDVIRRAVIAAQSHRIQPKGRNLMAGKRTSAESLGVGYDRSRVPRVKGDHYPRASAAAFAPSTVKGRIAHPPRVQKKISKAINSKERKLAISSAIAATAMKEVVKARGHMVPEAVSLPLVVSDDIQALDSAAAVREMMESIGIWGDVTRVMESRKARGRRKYARGRGIRQAVGPLIVVSNDEKIGKAARNLPGVEVTTVSSLGAETLAPGTHPGRLTVWSESAIRLLAAPNGD